MTTAASLAMEAVSAPTIPSEKRAFVHQLFTAIASRYDWFNRLVSLGMDQGWRRRAVELGGVAPGMCVLDVCAGTGDLALLCAERLGVDGMVIGVDFTAPMLQAAVRKTERHRRAVRWLQGDAQWLPFPAESVDRVTIGFSTRNLSDLRGGLEEMIRVVKRGGHVVILETGRPSNALVRAGYFLFLVTVAPLIGVLLTGRIWPFTYLARSVKRFLTPAQMVALLESCGTQARHIPLSGGLASLYLATKT